MLADLNRSNQAIEETKTAVKALKLPIPPSSSTGIHISEIDTKAYNDKLNLILDNLTRAQVSTQGQVSHIPIAPASGFGPSQTSPLIQQLRSIANDLNNYMLMSRAGERIAIEKEFSHDPSHPSPTNLPDRYKDKIKGINELERIYYAPTQSKIDTLRPEALKELQMSASERAKDDERYNSLVKAVSAQYPPPTKIDDAQPKTSKYSDLATYLLDLADRLSKLQTQTSNTTLLPNRNP